VSGTATLPTLPLPLPLPFELDDAHEARQPAEARGISRDGVRLMLSDGEDAPREAVFSSLPDLLEPGDLVVVNTSATVPAAIDAKLPGGRGIVLHVSTELPGGLWMVGPRRPLVGGAPAPLELEQAPTMLALAGGATVHLLRLAPSSHRLWLATVPDGTDVRAELAIAGRPIRYAYVERDWPLDA
jgi:S-adenosylmethionine:tRNA ribosyltransferase-isomerase